MEHGGLMRRLCVGMVWVGLAGAAWAQSLSFSRIEIPVGPGCCSIVSGDFNGDGKPDLAVTYSDSVQTALSGGGSRILVLLGKGDGTFTVKPMNGDFGTGLILVSAVDVNGDKKLDLVATNLSGQQQTLVFAGNGDGSFQPPRVVAPEALLGIGDFNGDGKPDLLFSHLGIRLGNGDGTFGSLISSPAAENFTPLNFGIAIAVGDFNGDGKADIAFTSPLHGQQGTVYVWLANGDGTFTMAVAVTAYQEFYRLEGHPLVAGDFNGDGKLDIALKAYVNDPLNPQGSPRIAVLAGNGDGTFQPTGLSQISGNAMAVGDFNGDGKLDLAVDSSVLLGNGDGTFQNQIFFGYGVATVLNPQIAVADFNQDGKADLVLASHASGVLNDGSEPAFISTGISVLRNDSPGGSYAVSGVSAASGESLLAPESLASIIGSNLATQTATAPSPVNLPPFLGGISLHVRDAFGVDRLAPLLSVSPERINFLVPPDTAEGFATLNIDKGSPGFVEGTRATLVQKLAPGFFTADGSGGGPPAAEAVRVLPDGSQAPVAVFSCAQGKCAAAPIDMSDGLPVFLSLYGTGLRATGRLGNGSIDARCLINNAAAVVTYAGPQTYSLGLDQVNLRLPQIHNVGEADLVCNFEFYSDTGHEDVFARPVRINIK